MIKLLHKTASIKWIVLLGVVGLTLQCRTVTLSDLRGYHTPDALILEVDFEKFPDMECGPYAAYTLLNYYYPERIIYPLEYKALELTWAFEIVEHLRGYGLTADLEEGNLTRLRMQLLNEDIPIVFLRRGLFRRYGHYALFTGYDFSKGYVYLSDEKKDYRLPLYTFLRAWDKGDKYFISVSISGEGE